MVSTFETPEHPSPDLISRDPVVHAAQQRASSQCEASTSRRAASSAAPHNQHRPITGHLESLQQLILRELATCVGLGPTYRTAASRFTIPLLQAAWKLLITHLDNSTASNLTVIEHSVFNAAEIACLSVLLRHSAMLTHLPLTVPYNTYGAEAVAVSAACSLLAASLSENVALTELTISFSRRDFARILAQGGRGTAQVSLLWGHVLAAFKAALKVSLCDMCMEGNSA